MCPPPPPTLVGIGLMLEVPCTSSQFTGCGLWSWVEFDLETAPMTMAVTVSGRVSVAGQVPAQSVPG